MPKFIVADALHFVTGPEHWRIKSLKFSLMWFEKDAVGLSKDFKGIEVRKQIVYHDLKQLRTVKKSILERSI